VLGTLGEEMLCRVTQVLSFMGQSGHGQEARETGKKSSDASVSEHVLSFEWTLKTKDEMVCLEDSSGRSCTRLNTSQRSIRVLEDILSV
jgi:hypothetical protein